LAGPEIGAKADINAAVRASTNRSRRPRARIGRSRRPPSS